MTSASTKANIWWVKLSVSIFDESIWTVIEQMPEADAIFVIWIRILCIAAKNPCDGYLRLSQDVAIDLEMLAALVRRPVNTVRLALGVFQKFGMLSLDDVRNGGSVTQQYRIVEWHRYQGIDVTHQRALTRDRVRRHRDRKRREELPAPKKDVDDQDISDGPGGGCNALQDVTCNDSNELRNVSGNAKNVTVTPIEVDVEVEVEEETERDPVVTKGESVSPSPSQTLLTQPARCARQPLGLLLRDGTTYTPTAEWISETSRYFPDIDVESELLAMAAWCRTAKPRKRRTREDIEAWVTTWLTTEQRARANAAKKRPAQPKELLPIDAGDRPEDIPWLVELRAKQERTGS